MTLLNKLNNIYKIVKRKRNISALWNKLISLKQYKIHSSIAAPYPTSLMIEPTNVCNLSCPTCPTGAGKLRRPPGFMPLDRYKIIIDELSNVLLDLTLHNYGEPLLHKQICEMIKYASIKGINVRLSTNGHFFRDRNYVQKLLLAGLVDLKISLDGASQETYEKFRMGGDFDEIIRGAKLLTEEKKKLHLSIPNIEMQFILMKPNQHEMEKVHKIAEDTGVDRLYIKSVGIGMYDVDFMS